jgi:hypothetical protein
MRDTDRSILANAVHGVFEFTEEEIGRIGNLAAELRAFWTPQ